MGSDGNNWMHTRTFLGGLVPMSLKSLHDGLFALIYSAPASGDESDRMSRRVFFGGLMLDMNLGDASVSLGVCVIGWPV